jgi:hypothetical protein
MVDNIQYVAYADMGNVSNEGMALNIKNVKDRFELSLRGITFLLHSDKDMLLQKVVDNIPHYQKLNPYALALGYIMCDPSGKPDADLLMDSENYRINENDYNGEPLKNKLNSSDIIRYARLYQRLKAEDPVFQAAPEPEYQDEYRDDLSDEENMYDGWGGDGDSDGDSDDMF